MGLFVVVIREAGGHDHLPYLYLAYSAEEAADYHREHNPRDEVMAVHKQFPMLLENPLGPTRVPYRGE